MGGLLFERAVETLRNVGRRRIQKQHRTRRRRICEDWQPTYQIRRSIDEHRIGGIDRVQPKLQPVGCHQEVC